MKKIILSTLFTFAVSLIYSQEFNDQNIDLRTAEYNMLASQRSAKSYSSIQGSPYLNERYSKGSIYLKNDTINSVQLRYNILEDAIEFSKNNSSYTLAIPSSITKIKVGNKSFVKIEDEEENMKGLYEVFYEGDNFKFYKKHLVEFLPETEFRAYVEQKPDRFEAKKPKFYIETNGEIKRFKVSKKYYKKQFPDKYDQIKKFAKENKLSLNNNAYLLEIIKFIDANYSL